MYRAALSVQMQSNTAKFIGHHFTVHADNNPIHTAKPTQEFLRSRNKIFFSGQVNNLVSPQYSIDFFFFFNEDQAEWKISQNKQQQKVASVAALPYISNDFSLFHYFIAFYPVKPLNNLEVCTLVTVRPSDL